MRYIYYTIRFSVLTLIYISTILIFTLEKPSYIFNFLQKPLSNFGISIETLDGNLFSGLDIKGVNYQDKLKLDRFKLKIDWSKLEDRVLKIDDLRIKNLYIQEQFLETLLDKNGSQDSSSSLILPIDIDRVIIDRGEFSLAKGRYQQGEIGHFSLNFRDLNLGLDLNSSKVINGIWLRDFNLSSRRLSYKDFGLNLAKIKFNDLNISSSLDNILYTKSDIKIDGFRYLDYKLNFANLESDNLDLRLDYNGSSIIKNLYFENFDLNVDSVIYEKLRLNLAKVSFDKAKIKSLRDIYLNRAGIIVGGFGYLDYSLEYSKLDIDKLKLNLDGNFSILKLFTKDSSLLVDGGEYKDYAIDSANLNLSGLEGNLEDYRGGISLKLNSNIIDGDIRGFIKNSFIDLKGDIKPESSYLSKFLTNSDIKIDKNPYIKILKLRGDYRRYLDFNLNLKDISLKRDSYRLSSKRFLTSGKYNIEENSLALKLDTIINSNLGKLYLAGNTALDFDDINHTLKYNINTKVNLNRDFLSSYISGIELKRLNTIRILLNGNLENTKYKISTSKISLIKDDIILDTPLNLEGHGSILSGKIDFFGLSLKPDSNIGYGELIVTGDFNFKDFKSTFNHHTNFNLYPNRDYLNSILNEQNITLMETPSLSGKAEGGLSSIDTSLYSNVKFLYQGNILRLALDFPRFYLDFDDLYSEGYISLFIKSPNMEFGFVDNRFSGSLNSLEDITSDGNVYIKKFKGFGVDLNPILPMDINFKIKNRLADFNLSSNRLNIIGTSKNFDDISLSVKSKKLYLYKIISLPPELEHKYIALDLSLDTKISSKYINLKGSIFSNKKFKSYIKVLNSKKDKLHADFNIDHFKLNIDGDIDNKSFKANLNIDSISKFQNEISKVYNFDTLNIDGKLNSSLIFNRDRGSLKINTPKLELNGFNIEDISFGARYRNDLITLDTLTWRVSGFSNKKFNKKFYLKRAGKIYLGDKRYIDIKIYPNISIEANESENGLDGQLSLYKVPIAHPDYGSLFLSCDILYNQFDEKRIITGDITLKDMQIFYETKFLEANYDPDIIVVTKKRRKIKDKLKEDSFLKDTKIDISLSASHANYNTPDIDLFFDVNLNIYKDFGKGVTLLGRVEDINGHFDQTPKRFLVRNSNIVFQGGDEVNPLLDIRVEYELPQVLIEIYVGGYANRPKINFSSEPPMPKKDIMSYLLFGTSTKKLTDRQDSISREAELFILNQLARDFAYEFKLDRLFIKGDEAGEGYAIEAGKRVGRSSMIIIEGSKSGSSYILERDIGKNLKLRIGEHIKEHQSQSIDIFYRKRFK